MEWCQRSGKHIHKSRAEAGDIKSRTGSYKQAQIAAYLCSFCNGWHLGHEPVKHWSRRKKRNRGDRSMATGSTAVGNLEITSTTGDLNRILITYTSDARKLTRKYQEDLIALGMKAELDSNAILAREPELAVGD